MDLSFQGALAASYKSTLQKIRILSEDWIHHQIYCPSCGKTDIGRYRNNSPVADFFCPHCREDFELKSQAKIFGTKIVDGAYRTMMEQLKGSQNPNLLLLHYDQETLSVANLIVVPKQFFVPGMIEERKPLSPSARRAGWVGCKISLQRIPAAGRIFIVRDRAIEPKRLVIENWRKTLFLRDQQDLRAKEWLLDIINCIEKIGKTTFTISELYRFEGDLRLIYPSNQHIRAKMRQKLQVLRDTDYLEFLGKGVYRLKAKGLR